jgi:hypothetical protein
VHPPKWSWRRRAGAWCTTGPTDVVGAKSAYSNHYPPPVHQRFHKIAIQQTIEWLDYHDIPYWDLCFMKDKAAVGADLYIEDSPENIESLRADGHPTIVLKNSTNRQLPGPSVDSWSDVAALVEQAIEVWAHRGAKELVGTRLSFSSTVSSTLICFSRQSAFS